MRIRQLYQDGTKITVWPLRVTYLPATETQVLIWAPKSLFRHAVDRNRLRRQMRAAWRQNKAPLEQKEQKYRIAFNYIDRQMQEYSVIEHAVKKAVKKLHEATDA